MQTPFIGTIIMFGGNFAPVDWAFCNGALLPISQYDALYSLIGTTYGGDGVNTFALPDLRSRIPVSQGQGPGLSNYTLGQRAGTESVTLLASNLPAHSHTVNSNSAAATTTDPTNAFLATQAQLQEYNPGNTANAVMNGGAISNSPGGQPHYNIMPSLAVNYIIALNGIYPTQN
ncbi:MAG: phage tail protein [Bacteroidetes bacterium]|nr:phage tail protein [Bacteroidota bacterium]